MFLYHNFSSSSFLLLIFSLLIFLSSANHYNQGSCSDFESEPSSSTMATLGGLRESHGASNDAEIESLARFAVDEHNKKEVFF